MDNPNDIPATLATAPESNMLLMPVHVAAVVPFEDYAEHSKLTIKQQLRVSLLLKIFIEMMRDPAGVVATSERLAAMNPGEGFSGSNLRALYYKFKKRGWRALAKIYKGPQKLPEEFVQEVRRRMESNARSSRSAMAEMRTEWAEGVSIPGYGTWKEYHAITRPTEDVPERYPFGFMPPGWSESNLYTKQSSKAEQKLARLGYAAMQRYIPHVVRDLGQLRKMELIVIDDFEIDQLVQAWNPETKRWQICRCAGLLAIDASTRRKLAMGLKPRFTDDEGKKMSITRADVQSLLHSVFSTHGLPKDYGCTILCENAAAAITPDFELALELLLGVQVARTGLIHEKTLRNGFIQSGGKPWEKGMIESLFNLMHNTAGALPGQKGASYQLKPADLEAKILYTEKVLNVDGLSPEAAKEIRTPFLHVDPMLTGYEKIFSRLENRTDHKCQGFLEIHEYHLPGVAGLVPESALLTLSQEQVLSSVPVPRKESPVERWERISEQVKLVPVTPHVLACLLLTPKKITLKNHRLSFTHAGEGFTFADADSEVMKLAEGTELLGYYDAGRPNVLHVTDLKGRFVGSVRRRGAIDIRDHAALSNEAGEIARMVRSLVVNPVRERHAAADQKLADDDAHNVRVQIEAGVQKPVRMQPEPKSNGITAKLARAQPPARDAFAAGTQLATAISAHVGEADAVAAQRASVRAQAQALSAADLADFNAPDAPLPGDGSDKHRDASMQQRCSSGDADTLGSYL